MTPVITIFVRHSDGCKYAGDETAKRCDCRKHFRWRDSNGVQHRQQAGTRSWPEAEQLKRELEDQLAGRVKAPEVKMLSDAVHVFLTDKRVQGITDGVHDRYETELSRFEAYCDSQRIFTVQAITKELLTGYAATWTRYESTQTRAAVRTRLLVFIRYCYEAQWLPRVVEPPKVKVAEPPTMPLSAEEYTQLLDAVYVTNSVHRNRKTPAVNPQGPKGLNAETTIKLRALVQLMRYSGLAIGDALTLERSKLRREGKYYTVATSRQKTGTDVCVPIPRSVAVELRLVAMLNRNKRFIFWSGAGQRNTIVKRWANRYMRPLFQAARLDDGSHMVSHRLRDTFAVDLLQKGVPLEEVSKALGHESIKTTERSYAKWVKGRQDRLTALVAGTWTEKGSVVKRRA